MIWTDILCFHQPSIVQSVILFVFVHNPTLLIHQSREIQHTINDTIYTWQPDNSIKLDTNNTFAKVRYLNIPYTTCWHVLNSFINILIQFRFSTCCMSSAPTICKNHKHSKVWIMLYRVTVLKENYDCCLFHFDERCINYT